MERGIVTYGSTNVHSEMVFDKYSKHIEGEVTIQFRSFGDMSEFLNSDGTINEDMLNMTIVKKILKLSVEL